MEQDIIVKKKMQTLINNNFEAYIIGGAVRDLHLGLKPKDYDIFTNCSNLSELFPNGNIIGNELRQEKILTIVDDNIEISTYRANGNRTELANDLAIHCSTCDFTINSIAMDINGNIIDYNDGILDIQHKILRCVGNPDIRFTEDPLRLMRLIRFTNKLNFNVENRTITSFKKNIGLLNTLPNERISDELLKILPYGIKHTEEIFSIILPEFLKLSDIDGGSNHNETLLEHSLNTYNAMHTISDNSLLLFTALIHDIGKIKVVALKEDGTNTFPNHEIEGYKFIKDWMKRYKFSNEQINYVTTLIKCHMYDIKMSKKGFLKLFKILDDNNVPIEHLMMLRWADSVGNKKRKYYKYGEKNKELIRKYYELKYTKEPFKITDLAINGHDVMEYGLSGKDIGDTLQHIFDEVQDGILVNERKDLMQYLHFYIGENYEEKTLKNDKKIEYPSSWKENES